MANFLKSFQSSKTRNIVIIIVIIFVSIILFAVYRAMYGKQILAGRAEVSAVPEGAGFKPGAKGLSKEYLKSLVEEDKRIAEEAIRKGESALPTLVDTGDRGDALGRQLGAEENGECYKQCLACCQREESTSSLLNKWVKNGDISAEAAAELSKLEDKDLSVSDYAAELNRLVREGKLTPEQAKKLLEAYRRQKEGAVTTEACAALLDDLLVTGKLGPADADNLRALERKAVSVSDYEAVLTKLTKEGKLTPKDKNSLDACYNRRAEESAAAPKAPAAEMPDETVNRMLQAGEISKAVADEIESFLKTNPTAANYAALLNRLVEAGRLTAEKAIELLAAFRKARGDVQVTTKDEEVAALQKAQQERQLRAQMEEMQRRAEEKKRREQLAQTEAMQQRLQNLQAAMSTQAQTLFTSWNAVQQRYIQGPVAEGKKEGEAGETSAAGEASSEAAKTGGKSAPIIKAGTIMFGVLDVSVNSDQPGPIMATIVAGKYKGGKLLGSMTKTPDNERVMLQFNTITMPEWPDVVQINAVAINPDTAKTALASDVNHHYLMRYGSLFAASFLEGYAEALKQSGSTDTSKEGETTTQNPFLSPKEKIFVGLGAVGEKLNDVLKDQFNKPPTIKVDAGVGIGILFTSSATLPINNKEVK